jgi:hypothetical protein
VIFTAILATPSNSWLKIYTNSQAAINRLNQALNRNDKSNHILWQDNFCIIYAAKEVIRDKSLHFDLFKVRHSDDIWNNAANNIAKHAREISIINIDRCIDLNRLYNLHCLLFYPTWNDIILDRNVQKFNSLVFNYLIESNWSCTTQWTDTFDLGIIPMNGRLWKYIQSISHSNLLLTILYNLPSDASIICYQQWLIFKNSQLYMITLFVHHAIKKSKPWNIFWYVHSYNQHG